MQIGLPSSQGSGAALNCHTKLGLKWRNFRISVLNSSCRYFPFLLRHISLFVSIQVYDSNLHVRLVQLRSSDAFSVRSSEGLEVIVRRTPGPAWLGDVLHGPVYLCHWQYHLPVYHQDQIDRAKRLWRVTVYQKEEVKNT